MPPLWTSLLLSEGLAVSALVHGRILLVGAYQDAVQRAIVLGIAVISALLNGAFDALVGIAVHVLFLLCFGLRSYCAPFSENHTQGCILPIIVICF